MNKNRPINQDLTAFSFPVTSISSILHRISGVLLFLSVPLCLWALQLSFTPEGFTKLQSLLSNTLAKLVMWLIMSMLAYHILAGIRHLFMDGGMGETLATARVTAYGVIIFSVIISVILGAYIW